MKVQWFLPIGTMIISGMLGAASYESDQNDRQGRLGSRMYNQQTKDFDEDDLRDDDEVNFNRQSRGYSPNIQDGSNYQDENFDDRNVYRENARDSDKYIGARDRYSNRGARSRYGNHNGRYYRNGYYHNRPYNYRRHYYSNPYNYRYYNGYYYDDYDSDDEINIYVPGVGGVHLGN